MLANIEVIRVAQSVMDVFFGILFFCGALFFARRAGKSRTLAGTLGHIALALLLLGSFLGTLLSPTAGWETYNQVAPGVYQDSLGFLRRMNIPTNAPVVQKVGNPKDSGYICRWHTWFRVVYAKANYDFNHATRDLVFYRSDKEALLANNRIVGLPKDIESTVINGGTDVFWRHDHYGQSQSGFEMLAKTKAGAARIEKWVFN